MSKEIIQISDFKKEIAQVIGSKENLAQLLTTTFKGLQQPQAEQAMLEGMLRGFTIKDFLEKNIYAVPYGGAYSLITSIDHARKIGMRSGIVGVSEPEYTLDEDKKCISCKVTVKRKFDEYIGEYSALVYFSEYTTGKNLWASKPMTMIAKVAEMHALRKACPEELSQTYVQEENEQSQVIDVSENTNDDELETIREEVSKITTREELKIFATTRAKGKGKEVVKIITDKLEQLKKESYVENLNPADYPFPDEQ